MIGRIKHFTLNGKRLPKGKYTIAITVTDDDAIVTSVKKLQNNNNEWQEIFKQAMEDKQ